MLKPICSVALRKNKNQLIDILQNLLQSIKCTLFMISPKLQVISRPNSKVFRIFCDQQVFRL